MELRWERLISSYQCDSRIADAEFLFAKRQYLAKTGRKCGADDVIVYTIRQSFVPGEITPEEANSLGYIATWSKDKSLPELKASLETISKTANILITSIDRHFQEICKEQGIDLTAQQPELAPPSAAPDTPERFISDMLDMLDRLYQAGLIKKNFPPDNREQTKANLVRTLQANPSIVRATLDVIASDKM